MVQLQNGHFLVLAHAEERVVRDAPPPDDRCATTLCCYLVMCVYAYLYAAMSISVNPSFNVRLPHAARLRAMMK